MKKINIITISFCLVMVTGCFAQNSIKQKPVEKQRGPADFPQLSFTNIPGAPKLSNPILIAGTDQPILAQGHGLAAPAFYDWDGDGLKDLLVGEFGTGLENGKYMGNFIRVYKNIGTEEKPAFTGRFDYARPPFELLAKANGTPYSVDQFCCMGFTPQFVDLNKDGMADMITGLYYGEVSWFRGTEKGFLPGETLQQEGGDPRGKDHVKNQYYWLYSSASFGDFTGDGLPDLITGGRSLRISKNIGNSDNPQFGKREMLLDTEGQPLKIYEYTPDELAEKKKFESIFKEPVATGGDIDISPYVVDWDNDGNLDLLVTNSYSHTGLATVTFFKGVKTGKGYRFKTGIPLFTAPAGQKAFPGSGPRVFVCDWNNDGVNDLLIGAAVLTVHDAFSGQFSWNWEAGQKLLPAGKDPANVKENISEDDLKRYQQSIKDKLPEGISMDDYMTLRHKGFIYVLLGKK